MASRSLMMKVFVLLLLLLVLEVKEVVRAQPPSAATLSPTKHPKTKDPTTSKPTEPTPLPTNLPTVLPTTSKPTTSSPTTPKPTTQAPTSKPTTVSPTNYPTTAKPTSHPATPKPTNFPVTSSPTTAKPTAHPTTKSPTHHPVTSSPTTAKPTSHPTTAKPTNFPTTSTPTVPTNTPTTSSPTNFPTTKSPTTASPTTSTPTKFPTTKTPSHLPTTASPTIFPTTHVPTTGTPTHLPTTAKPTNFPTTSTPTITHAPSMYPTTGTPTVFPTTGKPTTRQPVTKKPTPIPNISPSKSPTDMPTTSPVTPAPTAQPTTLNPTTLAPTVNGSMVGPSTFDFYVTIRDFTPIHPHFELLYFPLGTSSPIAVLADTGLTMWVIHMQIESYLVEEEGTGLYKPLYCTPEHRDVNGYCGAPLSGTGPPTFGDFPADAEPGFHAWYHDTALPGWNSSHIFNNRRSGHIITMTNDGSGLFTFASSTSPGSGFFPIDSPYATDENFGNYEKYDHNFHFTTEYHGYFNYTGGEHLYFSGDDDVWVFINNTLQVDIGGVHERMINSVQLDDIVPPLIIGEIYPVDIFHAERHTVGSNFKLQTTLVLPCNAIGKGVTQIDFPANFSASDYFFLGGETYGIVNDTVPGQETFILTDGTQEYTAGYVFHRVEQNIGAGFITEFTVNIAPHSEGFAFVLQTQGLTNLNGGVGGDLGMANMAGSIAILFDFCMERSLGYCETSQVRIHSAGPLELNNPGLYTRLAFGELHRTANFTNCTDHLVRIEYLVNPPWIQVFLDNSLYLILRDVAIEDFLGSTAAYAGFTASTGGVNQTGTIAITSWNFQTVTIEDSYTQWVSNKYASPISILADDEQTAYFQIRNLDACNNTVEYGGFSSRVYARFINLATGVPVEATILDNNNGTYTAALSTSTVGNFSLQMMFGQGCEWGVPSTDCWADSIGFAVTTRPLPPTPTPPPIAPALTSSALIGIGVGTAIFVGVSGIFGLFLWRKRKQWLRDMKFIEEGKLAKLNQGLDIQGDAEYDQVAKKLQATQEEINRRKAADLRNADRSAEIQALEKQKAEMQESVLALKMKKQNNETDVSVAPAFPRVPKKAFLPTADT